MRAILTYHSIDDSGTVLSVSPATFRDQMRWLAESGIRTVSVDEIAALDGGTDAVAITFDDGLESFAGEAWPVLEDAGMPVTLYVVTALAGTFNRWDADSHAPPARRLLDWDAIGRLAERGVAVGSHTRAHPDLTTLSASALADEIEGSRRDIEAAIGAPATSFAYPYGAVSTEAAARVRACYRTACTTELRALAAGDEAHLLPRLDMYYFRKPGQLEAWGSRRFRGRLCLRAWARSLRRAGTQVRSRAERAS
jgi:peptidoglycan/xylan/chitin deacetylase (PgdA/CDA1 family)